MNKRYPCSAVLDENGEPTAAKDWLGNWFCVGDTVLYCISAGRGQMLAYGIVQKLRVKESSTRYWSRDHLGSEVPKEEWVVEVQVLTAGSSGHWGNGKRTRAAWVNEMNITAVEGLETGLKSKIDK